MLLVATVLLAALMPAALHAQDDGDEIPLGDIARNLRKNASSTKPVIDDDNLSVVMAQAESHQNVSSTLRYLMSGDSKGFQVSAPDVTCNLAFTANVKALLSTTQYSEMELPASELPKLEGPATIEGDALTVAMFNATTWHVSEIAVAFTLVKKAPDDSQDIAAQSAIDELRREKKQDTTVIYRMRAAAPPWMRSAFSARLSVPVQPGDEWHWAIVQAKGYPPQGNVGAVRAAANSVEPRPDPVAPPMPEATPLAPQQPQ